MARNYLYSDSVETKMKGIGNLLDDTMMKDQQIDNVLEHFHESLLNDNGIWCGPGFGTCSYEKRLENLRESLDGIESGDLLLRMYRRLERIVRKLQEEEHRPIANKGFVNWKRNVL